MDIKVKSNIDSGLNKIINSLNNANGQIIENQFKSSKIELAPNDRQAWVNYIADQYEKKQSFQKPPSELNIVKEDVLSVISKRIIQRIMGKK